METEIILKGDFTNEIALNASPQVYRLRDFLLDGKRVTCDVARLNLAIGGSALPRRIKDCKDFLNMKIDSRWKPYKTAYGVKTRIREYSMTEENIKEYLETKIELKIVYPSRKKLQINSMQ